MVGSKQEVHTCIYYKKTQLLFLMVVAVVFILEGVWLIDMSYWPAAFAPTSLRIIAALLIGFFAIPFCIYGKKIFQLAPAYIIKPDGFVDNASTVKHEFIHWDNVEGLQLYKQQVTGFLQFRFSIKYVKVNLKNPTAYIDKFIGFKGLFLRFNLQRYHSPLLLSTTGMKIKPQELYHLLEQHLVDYHQKKMQH